MLLPLKIIKGKFIKSKISKLLCFTILFSFSLSASELPPCPIVDDLVNVTTGHLYLNKIDSIALGKEPILFTRKYLNITNLLEESSDEDLIYPNELESEEYKLCGWSFLKYTKACIEYDKGGRRLDIYDSNGSVLRFDFPKLNKKRKNTSRTLKLRNLFMGFLK